MRRMDLKVTAVYLLFLAALGLQDNPPSPGDGHPPLLSVSPACEAIIIK